MRSTRRFSHGQDHARGRAQVLRPRIVIIKGADLDIEDGSFVVFVGPSGCGKTTLLRLIAGLEDVTGGRILIDGNERRRRAARQARPLDGVPVLRALSAYERARQHRLRPQDGRAAARTRSTARSRRRPPAQPDALSRPQAARSLRRAAPARRHRPRHRARAEGLPVRRAFIESRCGAAGADAHRGDHACNSSSPPRRSM